MSDFASMELLLDFMWLIQTVFYVWALPLNSRTSTLRRRTPS